jgi:mannonate dehydratase
MKLGLGLYRYMLTTDSFRFAKQAGATHLVAHAALTIIGAE